MFARDNLLRKTVGALNLRALIYRRILGAQSERPTGRRHQPRSRHSARCGRSATARKWIAWLAIGAVLTALVKLIAAVPGWIT